MTELDLERIKEQVQASEKNQHNRYRGYEYKDGMSIETDFYLTAISPATILALVAKIERLQEENTTIRANYDDRCEDIARLCKEVERLQTENTRLTHTIETSVHYWETSTEVDHEHDA